MTGPKPTRVAEQRHTAKTRRLLPAASCDTIQVLRCHDVLMPYAAPEFCLGKAIG